MKVLLLTAAAFMAFTGSIFAQNLPPDYNWEVGLSAGLNVITRPLGPAEAYQGTRTNLVHHYSLRASYFFNDHWSLTFDLGESQWETFGTWQLHDTYGQLLQSRPITFLIADHAVTESFEMNYSIPFYTKYTNFKRSDIYFGAMFGLVTTVNDNSLSSSKYNAAPDSTYTYTSKYDYGYGIGVSFGAQIGYTYFIVPRLGVNIELAARYAGVKTNDDHYEGENDHYHLLYFPETIGLRWRF